MLASFTMQHSLASLLHRIVAVPAVYERIQRLVGVSVSHKRLSAQIASLASSALYIDIGGGTGLMKRQLNLSCRYICLDNDLVKLKGFRRREPDGAALYASAYSLPLQSKSVDRAMLMFVSHHIPDEALPTVISESMRILKDDGKLIFLDAVWEPKSIASRLLWKYDRGSFPRTDQVMEGILSAYGDIAHKESYVVYHHYVLCIVTHKHPMQ